MAAPSFRRASLWACWCCRSSSSTPRRHPRRAGSLRNASYGLGATKWQTTWHHVLPSALPGILTGTILAISRAIGETAPVVVGASTAISFDPSSPFSKFTTLPIQIYQWTSRPQAEFRGLAAAAILVLSDHAAQPECCRHPVAKSLHEESLVHG